MAGSTPIYGFPYPESSDLVANYPALGQDLAEDIESVIAGLGSGLNIMSPSSIANSGGSASASGGEVSFTGVSSVSLNGVFTSAYENYKMLINAVSTDAANIGLRLRVSGSDNSTASSYSSQRLSVRSTTVTGTVTNDNSMIIASFGTNAQDLVEGTLGRPFVAATTRLQFHGNYTGTSLDVNDIHLRYGYHNQTTSYDGFSLIATSGTITGKIRVYGYRNA